MNLADIGIAQSWRQADLGRQGVRLIGVDLLRAVAIVHVIAVHLAQYYLQPSSALRSALMAHSSDGVTLFFVVSGFVITRTIMHREADIHRMSLRSFYITRIARIQPLLIGSVLLGALMLSLGIRAEPFESADHPPFSFPFWLSLLTFSFNWLRLLVAQHGFEGWGLHWNVMWSLAIEEQFYLLLPILFIGQKPKRFVPTLVAVIVACMLLRNAGQSRLVAWDFASFAGFDALGLGVLTAYLAHRSDPRLSLWLMAAGVFAIAIGATATDGRSLLIAYGAAAFVLGAQARDVIFSRVKLPARLGQLSYEMYLLHPLVLAALLPTLRAASMSFDLALPLVVAAVAFLAAIVEATFTRPSNAWLRKALLRTSPDSGLQTPPPAYAAPAREATRSVKDVLRALKRGFRVQS